MSDSDEDRKNEFATYGIYGSDFTAPKMQGETPVEKPAPKSEKVRMLEFFKGVSEETSKIILEGYCPRCHDHNLKIEWVQVGIGYKECARCHWKDY